MCICVTRLSSRLRFSVFWEAERDTIDEHMNNYTKFLTDLVNVDVKIEEEDKGLVLLNSLLDEEYETFTLTLINGK